MKASHSLSINLDQRSLMSRIKVISLSTAFCFLILGYIANSQQPTANNQQHIYVLLDVSQSMLVQDTPRGQSRLSFAKEVLKSFILQSSVSSRGVSIFAGETQIITPLTSDSDTLLNLVQSVDNTNITKQGSDILGALQSTLYRFSSGNETKMLILLSDGSDDIPNLSQELIQQYKNLHIHVIVGGVGTEQGGPILLPSTINGEVQYKIYEGKPVIVGLNEPSLTSIAQQLGGEYIHLESLDNRANLIKSLSGTQSKIHWWWFAGWCSILIFLGSPYLIRGRKKQKK